MTEPARFGAHAPNLLQASILGVSRRLPATKLGRTLASPLKNLLVASVRSAIDVETFGARTRLYPRDNLTDKRALITPQLFDPAERAAIADRLHPAFVFIDAGANTGLYSLFVAAEAGAGARVVAIEPQPGVKERLAFNITANAWGHRIAHAEVALAEGPGEAELIVRAANVGASGLARGATHAGEASVTVPTQSLLAVMDAHGVTQADALKIDIEGAEDRVLPPFFRDCPEHRLPAMIIMEILSKDWTVDCVAAAKDAGYREAGRTRRNVILTRD